MTAKKARPERREPLPPPPTARPVTETPGPWTHAGRGLRTYSIGLVLRLALGVLFFISLLVAVASGDTAATGAVTIVFSIASLFTGFFMLAGLSRFSRQPADSPGRSSARFAATVLALTVAIELFCLVLGAMAAAAGPDDSQIAERFTVYVSTLWRWAAALWLAHVGATIVAMWKLGPVVERQSPDNRRFILPALVLVAGIFVFLTWSALGTLRFGVTGTIMAISVTSLFLLSSMALYVAAIDHLSKLLLRAGPVRVPASKARTT